MWYDLEHWTRFASGRDQRIGSSWSCVGDGQPLWLTKAGRVMVVKTCVPFLRRKEALSNDHRCKMPLFLGWSVEKFRIGFFALRVVD